MCGAGGAQGSVSPEKTYVNLREHHRSKWLPHGEARVIRCLNVSYKGLVTTAPYLVNFNDMSLASPCLFSSVQRTLLLANDFTYAAQLL